jgi:hypothetical protein
MQYPPPFQTEEFSFAEDRLANVGLLHQIEDLELPYKQRLEFHRPIHGIQNRSHRFSGTLGV